MSAVFGILSLDGRTVDKSHIYKMRELLAHHGADAQDVYVRGNLAIGCCLNRIGLYSRTDAPIAVGPDETMVLAADALIYNRDELIQEYGLGDERVSNNELLAAAYRKWGDEFPKYLNGDFAFAIWEDGKLILGRDHLGVRPLYYYSDGAVFVFATDYRAILALPFIPKRIDERTLYDLLINSNFMMIEDTFFEGIQKIIPAHTLSIYGKRLSYKRYWAPGLKERIRYDTEEEYEKALYDKVLGAVKSRLCVTDAKIGADLSGGLDSAVVAILAGRELQKKNKELSLLFSWSPSFDTFERQEGDERTFIEEICAQEDFECFYVDSDTYMSDYQNLDRITLVEKKPGNFIGQTFANARSRDVPFMLSGWGGDEGISHRAGLFELLANGDWRYYLKEVAFLSQGSLFKSVKIVFSSAILTLFKPYGLLRLPNYRDNIASSSFNKTMKKYRKRVPLYFGSFPGKYIVSGSIQTRTELSALMGADYNVQYLYPFLDYAVVDFALSIPRHLFYKNGINRYIFRKAFEKILPKDLCWYIPKNDTARYGYFQERKKKADIEKILLDRLDETMFSKYIDFDRAKKLWASLKEKENKILEIKLKDQLVICYNIQKLLEWAQRAQGSGRNEQ